MIDNSILDTSKKNMYIKKNNYLFISGIVAIANVIFVNNYMLSLVVVITEVLILLYYFLNKKFTKFLSFYLIFLSLSFEFKEFIGSSNIYGFKNVRVFGINLGVIILLPTFIYIIFKGNKWLKIKYINKSLYNFNILMLTLFTTGLVFGLVNIFFNDNNIISLGNVMSLFFDRLYDLMLFPILIIILFLYILVNEKEEMESIPDVLVAILFGSVVAMMTSLITKKYGIYGGVTTLLAPMVTSYIPFMLLFFFNNEKLKSKLCIIISYIVGILIMIIYNASGKLIILVTVIPLILLYSVLKKKKPIKIIITLLIFPIVIYLFTMLFLNNYSDNILLRIKLDQVTSLFNVFDENWLINLPESPKFRVTELYNIVLEYKKKPWLIIFGKGYLGSIKDHVDMFNYSIGAFSDIQWIHETFYVLHTSFNTLFLTHGFIGIAFLIYIIRISYKKLYKSNWGIIGVYWFILYYGYSITISAFGLVSLLYALYEINSVEKSEELGVVVYE